MIKPREVARDGLAERYDETEVWQQGRGQRLGQSLWCLLHLHTFMRRCLVGSVVWSNRPMGASTDRLNDRWIDTRTDGRMSTAGGPIDRYEADA